MSSITVVDGADVNIDINVASVSGVSVVSQPASKISVAGIVAGRGDQYFVHEQGTPAATWMVQHNLGKKPSVTVVSSLDNVVHGSINYVDNNNVTITFDAGAFSGKAYFN